MRTTENMTTMDLDLQKLFEHQQHQSAHLPTISPHKIETYYRSRIFTAKAGLNPLSVAAQPILSLLPRLQASKHWPEQQELKDYLDHELKAFETNAKSNGISNEIILLGRLILIACIDDTILAFAKKNSALCDDTTLRTLCMSEVPLADHFFSILDRAAEYPLAHIDLLELIYLCIASGFKGKFHDKNISTDELTILSENLYQTICDQRQFQTNQLSQQTVATYKDLLKTKPTSLVKWWVLLVAFMAMMYGMVNYTLDLTAEPMLKQLHGDSARIARLNNNFVIN